MDMAVTLIIKKRLDPVGISGIDGRDFAVRVGMFYGRNGVVNASEPKMFWFGA